MLLPEFVSCNDHLQKWKGLGKLVVFNSCCRETLYGCICKTANNLCIIVLRTFSLGTRCLVQTESVASTLSPISSTFCGIKAVFSRLETLFHTEWSVWNLSTIFPMVDLFAVDAMLITCFGLYFKWTTLYFLMTIAVSY